jgi:hypothetical protein
MRNPLTTLAEWNARKLLRLKAKGRWPLFRHCSLAGALMGVVMWFLLMPLDYLWDGTLDSLNVEGVARRVTVAISVWFFFGWAIASSAGEGSPRDNC